MLYNVQYTCYENTLEHSQPKTQVGTVQINYIPSL